MSDDQDTGGGLMPILPSPDCSDPPLPKVDAEVEFGARSRRGSQRFVNDNHFLILRFGRRQETLVTSLPARDVPPDVEEYGHGMLIADGVGRAGEVASRLAISTLVHLASYFAQGHVRVDEPIAEEMMDRAERFYRAVNATLLRASEEGSQTLQTTLTMVYTAGAELFYAHVGHSRAYIFRDGHLLQLTRDQATHAGHPGDLAPTGQDVRSPQPGSLVTQTLAVTGRGGLRFDVERCGLLDGDLVLLCTSGLTGVVDDAQIANVLRLYGTPEAQCRALVDLAAAADSTKDVTVITARYQIRPRTDIPTRC
jgi:protein phosphatase